MKTARSSFAPALIVLACACSPPDDAPRGVDGSSNATDPIAGTTFAPGEPDTAVVFAAMDSVYARFTRAYELAEPDSVVALYTADPLYLPGQGMIVSGAQGLAGQFAFLRQGIEDGSVRRIRFESVERGASGDLAYDIGYYILRRESPDGTLTPASRGKFATIWRRQDTGDQATGQWKIHVDAFSPAPPPRTRD